MEETKSRKLHPVLEVLIIALVTFGISLLFGYATNPFVLKLFYAKMTWVITVAGIIQGILSLFLGGLICFKVIEKRSVHWGILLLIAVAYQWLSYLPSVMIASYLAPFGDVVLANFTKVRAFVSPVLRAVVMVLLVHLLTAPKKEVTASDPAMHIGLVGHVLLLLFTCGIWHLIWIYRTTRYLNCVADEPYRNPATKLLLCILVPFYAVYWVYKSAQRIDKLAKTADVVSDLAVVCLILELFVPLIPPILMQDKINKIVEVKQNNPER